MNEWLRLTVSGVLAGAVCAGLGFILGYRAGVRETERRWSQAVRHIEDAVARRAR